MKGVPKIRILSTPVQLLNKQDLIELLMQSMATGHVLFAHQNLHGAALVRSSEEMRRLYERLDYCWIDGMPIVWLARLCGLPAKGEHRNTQVDWVQELFQQMGETGRSVFYLGGSPEIAESIRVHLEAEYPGLRSFAHHGFLKPEELEPLRNRINEIRPDLLFLGMGMPRQELWLLQNHEHLDFGVAICSGATMEFFVGAQKMTTRTSGPMGLEWFFRLLNQPRRLGHRYLVEPWSLVAPAIADVFHYRIGAGRKERSRFLRAYEEQVIEPELRG